jgi:glycosyltransferase involved in cell wall biosynthesis
VVGRVTFAIPGDLETPTGGYRYARQVIAALRARGWLIDVIDLGAGFPHVSADQRAVAGARLLAAPTNGPIVVDGLALGVLPDEAREASRSQRLIGLVHHPLALETGLEPAAARALRNSETAALAATRHVITTDDSTAAILAADYGVARERITVARPGAPRVVPAGGSDDGTVRLLAVGAVVPRKGYDLLLDALAGLRELPWHLTIVGDRTRSAETAAALDRRIDGTQLGKRVTSTGAVSAAALEVLYRGADLFVQPSWFEGYGMAVADAIAYGLPVIATRTGAAVRNVSPQVGVLVAPGDLAALAAALRAFIGDPDLRAHCRTAALAAAQHLPGWDDTACAFETVFTRGL